MMGQRDIDDLLQSRYVPPPATNLAQRIIDQAQAQTQDNNRQTWHWNVLLNDVFGMFVLPKPAYALAASIIIGLVIGLQSGSGFDSYAQDLTSFLYMDEGDWL